MMSMLPGFNSDMLPQGNDKASQVGRRRPLSRGGLLRQPAAALGLQSTGAPRPAGRLAPPPTQPLTLPAHPTRPPTCTPQVMIKRYITIIESMTDDELDTTNIKKLQEPSRWGRGRSLLWGQACVGG
jgi:hypothetical protein